MNPGTIQRVELSCYDIPIHCPFCGSVALETDPEKQQNMRPCSHLLFVATDEGFEFRSSRFDNHMESAENDCGSDDTGMDELTDRVAMENALKFAVYVPAPSGFGAYIGFAP